MITEKDITKAEEEEKLWGESYLKGIMDFVKWTSTVAIAAILWVGNAITSEALAKVGREADFLTVVRLVLAKAGM